MAHPPVHFRAIWSGTLGNPSAPVEEFAFGLSATNYADSFPPANTMQTAVEALHQAFAQLGQGLTTQVSCTSARLVLIGADGLYMRRQNGAYTMVDSTGAALPGGQTARQPLQVAQAVTLHTDFGGPLGTGRFFLPCPHVGTLGDDGRINTTEQANQLGRVGSFLSAVETALDPLGVNIAVASGGSVVRGIAPAVREVTSYSLGRVLDTQRRRRNDLVEEYATANLSQ